jgi:ubiquinol-cytochrome c reductase cytochrome c1 subunit
MTIQNIIGGILSLLIASALYANTTSPIEIKSVKIDLADKTTLQRGARLFMNYCSGCHSLRYMRYNQMAKDLGLVTFDGKLDENLLVNNLIFTHSTIYDPIEISMPETDARQWFGVVPPDLSLSARKRGADWLYSYLKGFYEDKSRPFGTNNLLIPGVAMPNVLAPLVGRVIALKKKGQGDALSLNLLRIGDGEMSEYEFDNTVHDLVTFLVYVGEPVKLIRYRMGGFVITFLCILLVIVYQLKKNYWKNVTSP